MKTWFQNQRMKFKRCQKESQWVEKGMYLPQVRESPLPCALFPPVRDPLFCVEKCIMSKTVVFLIFTAQVYRFYSSIYSKPALATDITLSTYFQVKNWLERVTKAYSCCFYSQHGVPRHVGLGISNFRSYDFRYYISIVRMMWTENN